MREKKQKNHKISLMKSTSMAWPQCSSPSGKKYFSIIHFLQKKKKKKAFWTED
jgi:hypothetical protein